MSKCKAILIVMFFHVLFVCATSAFAGPPVIDDSGQVLIAETNERDIPKLVELLGREGAVSNTSAAALESFGSKSVPYLLEALDNKINSGQVMFVLGQIKTKESAEGLVKRIKDPSFVDADAAIAALGGYGDLAVPELSTLLKDERTKDRAKEVLKDIDPSNESRSLLRAMLDSDDANERGGAAYVLGYWRDSGSVTKIEKLVFDRDVNVREDALDGYGALYSETPEKYDLDLVAKVINTQDNEFATRKKAISMLRRIPGMRTSEVLLELIKNTKENRILTRLLFAVGRSSDDSMVVPILEILNGNTDPDVKGAAMSALGMLKAEEAVPYIADAIAKGNIVNDSMKYEGFQALTAIGKCVDCRPFLKYLGNDYESGCNDCDGFNDKLLDLIEMCARPGDKDIVNALETYKAKGDRRLAPRAEQILEKLK